MAQISNYETKVVPGIGLSWRTESFMHLRQNFSVNFPKSAENKEDIAIVVCGIIPFSFNEITAQMDFPLLFRYLICFQMTINVIFNFMYRVMENVLQILLFLLNAKNKQLFR